MTARSLILQWTSAAPPSLSPISFVGIGSNTIQNGGAEMAFDMVEPAGCAANDVLFAVIASRQSTNAIWGMPAGWVRLSAALNPTTGANPSVMMFAYRRGASVPPLSFAYPIVPSASIGFILAYRGLHTDNVPVAGAAATASGSSVSVTFPTVNPATGTIGGHILVAATAANTLTTYTNFMCASSALNKNSGTTQNETRNVCFGQWTERRDASPSASLSVAVFDAARTTTGTSGTPSVTAGTSANQAITMNWCEYVVVPNI